MATKPVDPFYAINRFVNPVPTKDYRPRRR